MKAALSLCGGEQPGTILGRNVAQMSLSEYTEPVARPSCGPEAVASWKCATANSRWTQALCNLDRSHKHAIVSMTVEQRESTSPIRFLASRRILLDLNGGVLSWPAAGHRSASRSFNDQCTVKVPDDRTYCRRSCRLGCCAVSFCMFLTPAIDTYMLFIAFLKNANRSLRKNILKVCAHVLYLFIMDFEIGHVQIRRPKNAPKFPQDGWLLF